MGTELRGRTSYLRISEFEIHNMDFEFEVRKSLNHKDDGPNELDLKVYGLDDTTLSRIVALNLYDPNKKKRTKKNAAIKGDINVQLHAGHGTTSPPMLFLGQAEVAIIKQDRAEKWLELKARDAGRTAVSSIVEKTYPAGAPVINAVRDCVAAMGLGEGNLSDVASLVSGSFAEATTLDGVASQLLTGLLSKARVSFSIQNGVTLFRRAGKTPETGVGTVLTYDTGLVGLPEVNHKGYVECRSLLVPDIFPSALVRLQTRYIKGDYFVHSVTSSGQRHGQEWYHKMELRAP